MDSRLSEYLQTLTRSEIEDILANAQPEPLKRKAASATKWTDLNDVGYCSKLHMPSRQLQKNAT
jgi:hypothetical protein